MIWGTRTSGVVTLQFESANNPQFDLWTALEMSFPRGDAVHGCRRRREMLLFPERNSLLVAIDSSALSETAGVINRRGEGRATTRLPRATMGWYRIAKVGDGKPPLKLNPRSDCVYRLHEVGIASNAIVLTPGAGIRLWPVTPPGSSHHLRLPTIWSV